MNCPYCGNKNLRVTNKRNTPEGIRRRRECLNCKRRFTTYEKPVEEELWIIKKDKSRERFKREKLEKGIKKAFEKRPIPADEINKMINSIEEQIRKRGDKEIKSSNIGEIVIKKIKKLDNIAYLRFASIYRDFQNIKDFKKELRSL
jgi:transcriptional repressor NrdR